MSPSTGKDHERQGAQRAVTVMAARAPTGGLDVSPLANAPMSGEGCGVSGVITARSDGGGEELARVVESVWGLVAPCRGWDMLPVDPRIHGPAGRNGGAAGVCRYRWSKWLLRR